jgi:hypothetical protein
MASVRPSFVAAELPAEALNSVRLALATTLGRAILEEQWCFVFYVLEAINALPGDQAFKPHDHHHIEEMLMVNLGFATCMYMFV